MPAESETPELFLLLREDLKGVRSDVFAELSGFRKDVQAMVATMVSKESFDQEVRHRDGETARLERDIEKERILRADQIKAEALARQALEEDIEESEKKRESSHRFAVTMAFSVAGTAITALVSLIVTLASIHH